MRKAADASIRARGVELVLGDFVDFSETSVVEGITTRNGKALKNADLVVSTPDFFLHDATIDVVFARYKPVDRGRTQSLFLPPSGGWPLTTLV
jgi:hypothetical protein